MPTRPSTRARTGPRFKNVDRRVVRAVRAFVDAKPYRLDHGGKVSALNTLAATCAQAYGLPAPRVTIEPHGARKGTLGFYDAQCNTIVVPRTSLMATLYQVGRVRGMDDRKAKDWALSAVHAASPSTLKAFVTKGTLRWRGARTLAA